MPDWLNSDILLGALIALAGVLAITAGVCARWRCLHRVTTQDVVAEEAKPLVSCPDCRSTKVRVSESLIPTQLPNGQWFEVNDQYGSATYEVSYTCEVCLKRWT